MKPLPTRTRSMGLIAATVGLCLAGAAPSHASTVTANPAGHQSGLTYEWQVQMGDNDSATYTGSVGSKSWAEPANPADRKGWTHTTDWTLLDLTSATGPTLVTLTLGRGATGSLFPAFGLYSGVEDVVSDLNSHTFTNVGNTNWIVDEGPPEIVAPANISYITHLANAGSPSGLQDNGAGLTSVSDSWVLTPGLYTLVYGGNPAFSLGQGNVSYAFSATLTTAPVPVPAAAYLFGSGLIGLAGLARRRLST